MGRPLKEKTIEEMNLLATTLNGDVVLGKQVGYNKYVVEDRVVRLVKQLVLENDALLTIEVNGVVEPVTKVLKNIFQTDSGIYAYKLINGKVVFENENVKLTATPTDETLEDNNVEVENTDKPVSEPEVEPEVEEDEEDGTETEVVEE